MRRWLAVSALSALVALSTITVALAQGVTQPFIYQGFLTQGGTPVNGVRQMHFRIYRVLTGGTPLWGTTSPIPVQVSNGLFTVQLNTDISIWTGEDLFLEIEVAGTTLTPRVRIGSTPYANTATLLNMFQTGTNNPNRMVITHSPAFPTWGLQYRDSDDSFHFLAGGTTVVRIGLGDGNVGINTTTPASLLHVQYASGQAGISSRGPSGDTWLPFSDGNAYISAANIIFRNSANTERVRITGAGNVGIGTTSPASKLHVQYASGQAGISSRGPSGDTWLPFSDGNAYISAANIIFRNNANVERMRITGAGDVGIGTSSPAAKLHVEGTARVKVLEITGADLAEKFPTTETLEPGIVVEIDPDNPGHLRKARGAYNKRVAGVVSGANGLSKGIILGNLEGSENHTPIAISGRVWVYADATHEAIEPGDLLTTSDTPGHAMKASDPSRAHGTILGKAMTRLEKGKTGFVLVLVNLQ
jgi:hypothetical protein